MRFVGKGQNVAIRDGAGYVLCEGATVRVDAVRDGIVRIRVSPSGRFEEKGSHLLDPALRPQGRVTAGSNGDVQAGGIRVVIREGMLRVLASDGAELFVGAPAGTFWVSEDGVGYRFVLHRKSRFYGFGEKSRGIDKRGERMVNWNLDLWGAGRAGVVDPRSTYPEPLYAGMPFFVENRDGRCHGLFANTGAMSFLDLGMDSGREMGISVREDVLDLFVLDGPTMEDVVAAYTGLTGRMPMPPLWSLGFHQCRWSYMSQKRAADIGRKMRRHGIPCDAVWLDIDYMDGYRVFTFNGKTFPDPAGLSRDLRRRGIRTVCIVDPGFKDDPAWDLCREGLDKGYFFTVDGQPYRGKVWPGDTLFPDFQKPEAREWFGGLCCDFAERFGVEGLWFDMNEPADQAGHWDGAVHRAFGNLYPHLEVKGAADAWDRRFPNRRRFFLTRAACPGSQRYTAIWTGDNMSRWDHLEMSIPMSCNLGISGMAFVGSDTGGFGGNAQPEMLARWTQYGAFTPFFRNHAARGTIDQEPWAFGRRIRNICRAYTRLRYRLLPYIYSAFRQAVERGVPVQRPMIFGWPDDARFATESSQYMFGDHVLVAPILGAGERRRRVALPAGKWVDFHSGETFDGAAAVSADAPLDRMPLFVRGGAPLPMWEPAESTEWIDRSRLRVECYPGGAARTPLYEDDGETRNHARGEYAKILLETRQEEGRRLFSRGPTEGCYRVPGRTVEVVFVGCSAKPARVLLREGGVERRIAWRRTRRRGEVSVRVPDCDDGFSVVMEEGA